MAYNNNIPLSTDLISKSQSQILGNFAAIDSGTTGTGIGFSRNHVTMTDATNGGLHSRVDYFNAVTSPALAGFISSAYPKTVAVTTPSSSNVELFYKNAGSDTQMTSSALDKTLGEGFIPGGLQIRAASTTLNNDNDTITFTKEFPTACLGVVVTISNSGAKPATINVTSFSATGFQAFHVPTTISGTLPINFSYIAIGY